MDTNYKVVKLTNGESIICEMKEYANEKYIIKTPLKMETVNEETSKGMIESLHLTAWISPFTESKYFELKESHVIIIADASVGLGAYYKNIVEKRNRLHIPEDVIDFEDNLNAEEMIDRDKINDILEEFIKTNKSKYH